MKKKNLIIIGLLLATLILEILPFGAVCIFKSQTETFKRVYSYFSGVPLGYGNFGPFYTALLTCLMLLLSILSLIFKKKNFDGILLMIAISSVFVSLIPLFSGVRFFSIIGAFISALLVLVSVCLAYKVKE